MAELKRLMDEERFDQARIAASAIVAEDPTNGQALAMLAYNHLRVGDGTPAREAADAALALLPDQPVANFVRGVFALGDCDYDLAENCFRKTVAQLPRDTAAIGNLATTLLQAGRPEEAGRLLENVLEVEPNDIGLLNSLGLVYSELGRHADAEPIYRRLIKIDPTLSRVWSNLAKQVLELGDRASALELFQKAIELDPEDEIAQCNLGIALILHGRLHEAIPHLRRSAELKPSFAPAHYNLATSSLMVGDFRLGWQEWQWRFPRRALERGKDNWVPVTPALPDNLAGCWVSLQGEQGIGDELFFLRFAPQLKARGARVAYRPISPKVESLIARLDFLDAKLTTRQEVEDGAIGPYWAGDLPLLLGMASLAEVPLPYHLRPDPARVARFFLQWLDALPPPYVGITWRAGTQSRKPMGGVYWNLSKELPLEAFVDVLRGLAGSIVVLQRNPRQEEIEYLARNLPMPVIDCSDVNEDLEEMLALLYLLNDVVGVSNTNVHLRAALGKGGRILVPQPSEYRWMAEGDESPWFPGFRVYREDITEGWAPALEKLRTDLSA